jgi:hypothetical protein
MPGNKASKKRDAQVAGMGPPSQPPPKKTKVEIELETRLTRLQQVLGNLPPIWEEHDPSFFMAEIRRMDKYINALTPTTAETYITSGELKIELDVLDALEEALKRPVESATAQDMRAGMIEYVAMVRTCFNGQS